MARSTPDTLVIPSTTRYLRAVRKFVEAHAQAKGFKRETIEEMKLAVDEACANVINHAYAGNEQGQVELQIDVENGAFTIIIRDQGQSFDEQRYTAPDLGRSVRSRKGGGYGVFIMRHLMDNVSYRKHGAINEVHLMKLLPSTADNANGIPPTS